MIPRSPFFSNIPAVQSVMLTRSSGFFRRSAIKEMRLISSNAASIYSTEEIHTFMCE